MLMLGINPGRLGAGSTGICFTDTKRCEADLGFPVEGMRTHEPSSDFFYRVVRAAGGAEAFTAVFMCKRSARSASPEWVRKAPTST